MDGGGSNPPVSTEEKQPRSKQCHGYEKRRASRDGRRSHRQALERGRLIMQTPEGKKVAAQLSAALTELADLSKISDLDAAMLWNQLVAHIRSARPQALLSLKDVL